MRRPAWRGPGRAMRPSRTAKPAWTISRWSSTCKVHAAYHALAEAEPERVKLVDGRAGIDEIEREVWSIVSTHV